MRIFILVAVSLTVTSCGQELPQMPELAKSSNNISTASDQIQQSPQSSPAHALPRENILSLWNMTGRHPYYIDLRAVQNLGIDDQVIVSSSADFYFSSGAVRCNARVSITGTEDTGTLVISNTIAVPRGTADSLCDTLDGHYSYEPVTGGIMLCENLDCFLWE